MIYMVTAGSKVSTRGHNSFIKNNGAPVYNPTKYKRGSIKLRKIQSIRNKTPQDIREYSEEKYKKYLCIVNKIEKALKYCNTDEIPSHIKDLRKNGLIDWLKTKTPLANVISKKLVFMLRRKCWDEFSAKKIHELLIDLEDTSLLAEIKFSNCSFKHVLNLINSSK